tara:strand:- start:1584 stop:2417 length:834 start_codon:yes stop_codon:yes gene_type:complete
LINLFYITNNISEAQIVDNLDIDWIFIDLEKIGKKERQVGRNTLFSDHSITDIEKIKNKIHNTKIIVRCNPIGEWSEKEFNELNARDSEIDMVILPYFKTKEEVNIFINLLDTRKIEPALLVETLDAITNLDEIIKIFPFRYLHLGLNDLHIERGTLSMFEPYVDGTLTKISSILKRNNQDFGIGGIGRIGANMSPSPECILTEHIRLKSNGVILSRSFKGNFLEKNKDFFRKELSHAVDDLRSYEKMANNLSNYQLTKNLKKMKKEMEVIKKNEKI